MDFGNSSLILRIASERCVCHANLVCAARVVKAVSCNMSRNAYASFKLMINKYIRASTCDMRAVVENVYQLYHNCNMHRLNSCHLKLASAFWCAQQCVLLHSCCVTHIFALQCRNKHGFAVCSMLCIDYIRRRFSFW